MKIFARLPILVLVIVFACQPFSLQAQWSAVGNAVSSYQSYPQHYSLAQDTAGILYVAYADLGNQYVVTVKKYAEATGWVNVGAPGFIKGSGLFYSPGISLAVNPVTNEPYIAIADDDSSNKVSVLRFDGTAWKYVGKKAFSPANACNIQLLFNSLGDPYVSFSHCYEGTCSVMRYSGGIWDYAGSANFANGLYLHMAIADNNAVMVAYRDNDNESKITVKRLDANSWQTVGAAGFSESEVQQINIAAGPNNTLYVCYTDYSLNNKLVVKNLQGNIWTTLGEPTISSFEASATDITVNKDGVPYVSFVDHVFPVAKKYEGGQWVALGTYITTVQSAYTSIICNRAGSPVVLMSQKQLSDLPWVYKYTPPAPCLQNTWTGAVSSNWNTPGNWSCNAVPAANSEVTIPAGTPNSPTVSGTFSVKTLTVSPGVNITVAEGAALNVGGQ